MEMLKKILFAIRDFLDIPVFKFGSAELTLWSFLYLLVLLVLLFYLTGKLRNWMVNRLLIKSKIDVGARMAAGAIVRYFLVAIGLLIILQTVGIDLTTLNVLAGAVGLGVGFGLQNIANNFISGLIILFERPIKIGDRIEVGAIEGDVVKIGARSTTVITNDNIAIIIPNSSFIAENVINWSHTEEKVRFRIPVSVAYGSDVRLIEKLLLEVAKENPDVLDDPPSVVRFMAFGDNGLQFELRAWSTTLVHRKGRLISALNFAIYDKFKEHKIEIPFPQRDLHIRSGAIEVKSSVQQ
ncbi:MAG: mechanosensitive ion channel [candidate division KSB1 bacterium]|nr:mechanosensitive ion channel [candidate division KSB1 bacterium]MDZ7304781.1 mechanosensitive ion channel [candidate division KSB1 bacterium]MDZ7313873.1 mechanosensitive ion channel [candidate division KSB1 bacterium]